MKNTKKLFALMLAVLMLLSVCAVAWASVTIPDELNGHTLKAYQIFKAGAQNGSEGALTDISWGDGVNGEALLTALKNESGFIVDEKNLFANCSTAQDVADVLSAFTDDSDGAKLFAKLAQENLIADKATNIDSETTLEKGYYLIVDAEYSDNAEIQAYNSYLLQVVDLLEIEVKTTSPTVEKKVKDSTSATLTDDGKETETGWQDSADYDIGDRVPFQLTATLGSQMEYFSTYMVEFEDTLSDGLTFDEGSVTVKIDGDLIGDNSKYTVEYTQDSNALTITFPDVVVLGAKENSKIVVEYTATLNDNAAIGIDGNPNEVKLEYYNNPNDLTETDHTPVDKVEVYTFKAVVNKVAPNPDYKEGEDESNKYIPLTGATFELQKKVGDNWVKVEEFASTEVNPISTFKWEGLDGDTDYQIVEISPPAGYNSIEPIEIKVSVSHSELADDPVVDTAVSTISQDGDIANGNLFVTQVINKSGATLPETGGIGTTIFYVAGGVLVLLAVVLLVTKRRVGEN